MDLRLAGSIHPINLLVFDCDGVLLDSMSAKIEAFSAWVPAAHADLRDAFMEIVMNGFGTSRTFHIESFYRELLHQAPDPAFLAAEVQRFTDICEPLCAASGWLRGAREFVEACIAAEVPCYVLSGMPQAALEGMLASAGGADLFDVMIGSPPGKPESLARILSETDTPAHRSLFIGDANADQVAALHVGAHFVYVPSAAERPQAEIATEVSDLRELLLKRG
jgi:phosphoglycolate phosphatase